MKIVGATGLGGLWAVRMGVAYSRNKLALRARLLNLNLRSQCSIFDSFRDIHVHIYAFLRFLGVKVANMARSTRLVILSKNIFTLCGRKRFLLPVTYFPTNLVYPYTVRVPGIKRRVLVHKEI